MLRRLVLAFEQVDRHLAVLDAGELERDADAITRRGAPVIVEDRLGHRLVSSRLNGAQAFSYFVTVCSMAPKIERPALSFISMRTVSPKRRNGVFASPVRIVSTTRISAMQE